MKKLILTITVVLAFFFSKAQPTISSVNPLKARIDSLVTITGTNFIANVDSNIVHFGPVRAVVTSATTNQLVVKVPLGAGYQPISVTTRSLIATANMPFGVSIEGQSPLSNLSFSAKIDSLVGTSIYECSSGDLDDDGKPDIILGNYPANTITIYRNTSNNNISFAKKIVINHGFGVPQVKPYDIDGDGKKDLVVADFNNSSFSVYLNTSVEPGDINFAPKVTIPTLGSSSPAYLTVNDLDGDGKLDVVLGNYPLNGISIFRNTSTNGVVSFAARQGIATIGTYPTAIEIADMNNDGKKDILVCNSQQNSISIFRNTSSIGNISVANSVEYATSLGVHDIGVADLNNDGKLDIVAADYAVSGAFTYANTISVLQSNVTSIGAFTNNSFNPYVTYNVGIGSRNLKLGDMDGDGKTDIVVGHAQSNHISILRNTSSNTAAISFASKSDIITGIQACFVELADLTNDGKLDIAVCNIGSNTISFLKNRLDEAPPVITNVSPLRANIDSLITITGQNFSTTNDSNIVYFGPVKATILNSSSNVVIAKLPLGTGYQPLSLTKKTVFGNGLTATANIPSNVKFNGNTMLSSASFEPKIDSLVGTSVYECSSSDLDGDGKPDLVIGNYPANTITIYRNNTSLGNIGFASKITISHGSGVPQVKIFDIDGDGKKDLITSNFNSASFSVYRNTSSIGNLSFAAKINISMSSFTTPNYLTADDIDGDGKLDIVASRYPSNGISIFRNTSIPAEISFAPRIDINTVGTFPTAIEIADMNNDGKKDILVCNSQQYSISIFRNTSTIGNISVANSVEYATSLGAHDIGVADLNNDGKLDIVAADYAIAGGAAYANTISVLQNNVANGAAFVNNSFNSYVTLNVGLGSRNLKLGDMDGDGKTDIVVGYAQSNYISLLRNTSIDNSTINFATKSDISTGIQACFVELADLNNDGKLDIAVSNIGANTVSFLKNNTVVLSNPLLLQFTASPKNNTVQLNWELSNTSKI
ncbi:MAG: FG-GAP-like repeat-containing protein, partial [Chitinophagaceae bacterium]